MKFYSPTTGGFYEEPIHGARLLEIIDPGYVAPPWPMIDDPNYIVPPVPQIPDPDGEGNIDDPNYEPPPVPQIPDPDYVPPIPPTVNVPNPETKIPLDAVEISDADHKALMDAQSLGQVIVPGPGGIPEAADPPPLETGELVALLLSRAQQYLDAFAATRNYDTITAAVSYAGSGFALFSREGAYAVRARDEVWTKAHEIIDAIIAGTRPAPTLEAFVIELPALAWPD